MNLNSSVDPISPLRSQRRYESAIRTFLQVKIFDAGARQHIAVAIAVAATTMDRNADLINVAIEELVKESYALPAFSTLDRLAGNVRSITKTFPIFEMSKLKNDTLYWCVCSIGHKLKPEIIWSICFSNGCGKYITAPANGW